MKFKTNSRKFQISRASCEHFLEKSIIFDLILFLNVLTSNPKDFVVDFHILLRPMNKSDMGTEEDAEPSISHDDHTRDNVNVGIFGEKHHFNCPPCHVENLSESESFPAIEHEFPPS